MKLTVAEEIRKRLGKLAPQKTSRFTARASELNVTREDGSRSTLEELHKKLSGEKPPVGESLDK